MMVHHPDCGVISSFPEFPGVSACHLQSLCRLQWWFWSLQSLAWFSAESRQNSQVSSFPKMMILKLSVSLTNNQTNSVLSLELLSNVILFSLQTNIEKHCVSHWNERFRWVLKLGTFSLCDSSSLVFKSRLNVWAPDFLYSTVLWHTPSPPGIEQCSLHNSGLQSSPEANRSAGKSVEAQNRSCRLHLERRAWWDGGVLHPDDPPVNFWQGF